METRSSISLSLSRRGSLTIPPDNPHDTSSWGKQPAHGSASVDSQSTSRGIGGWEDITQIYPVDTVIGAGERSRDTLSATADMEVNKLNLGLLGLLRLLEIP